MIIEFDGVQTAGDDQNTYDFEIVITRTVDDTPGAYEIVFAYDNISGTLAGPLTIGVENNGGDEAAALVNHSSADGALSNRFMVCFDSPQPGGNTAHQGEAPVSTPGELSPRLAEEPVVLTEPRNRYQGRFLNQRHLPLTSMQPE